MPGNGSNGTPYGPHEREAFLQRPNVSQPPRTGQGLNRARNAAAKQPVSTKVSTKVKSTPFLKLWVFEILCCVTTTGMLAALVSILAVYDQQPLSSWPYSVNLTTIVSLVVEFMKGAIVIITAEVVSQLKWKWFQKRARPLSEISVFDEASRGGWGAFRLMVSFHSWYLAAFASLIFLLSYAMGPAAQELVQLEDRMSPTTGRASVPVCESGQYHDASGLYPNMTVSLAAIGAVFEAIFQKPSTKDTSFTCESGNCTFPVYQTLEICSQCADISDRLEVWSSTATAETTSRAEPNSTFQANTVFQTVNGSLVPPEECIKPGGDAFCRYSLPSGMRADNDLPPVLIAKRDLDLMHPAFATKTPFMNLTAILGNMQDDPDPRIAAVECAMSFCVTAYNTSIQAGRLTSVPVATSDRISATAEDTWPLIGSISWVPGREIYVAPDTCYQPGGVVKKPPYQEGDGCTVEIEAVNGPALAYSIGQYVTGEGSWSSSSDVPVAWEGNADTLQAFYGSGRIADIEGTMKSLAATLSANARSSSDICNGRAALGDVRISEVYVVIQWPWIIIHASLVCASLVLFVITLISTRKDVIWKSSVLPFFLIGQNPGARLEPRANSDCGLSTIEELSSAVTVRLAPTPQGWEFAGSKSS